MCVFINIFGKNIPTYGLMMVLGLLVANLVCFFVNKKIKLNFDELILIEAYCFLGGFIGAKILYLIVSFHSIDWSRLTDLAYLNSLMLGGFVFYGGLIGGLIFAVLTGKIHKIKIQEYINNFIFAIPFIHSFGRVGCFLSGCCYGIEYSGIGAVVFPEKSFAPAGVSLFPIQLLEAILLMLLALLLVFFLLKLKCKYCLEIYLIGYAIIRFALEYLRFDEARGIFAGLSTSQWISIVMMILAIYLAVNKMKKGRC